MFVQKVSLSFQQPRKGDQKRRARGQEFDLILLVQSNSQRLVCSLLNLRPHHRADRFFDRTRIHRFAFRLLSETEVVRALESLARQYQEVVVLADVEDMADREIADALAVPVGTVMSRLSRGRKLLRAELANYANTLGIGKSAEEVPGSIKERQGGKSDAVS